MSITLSVHSVTSEQWRERENDENPHSLPYDSLIKMVSPNDPYASSSSTRIRDADVATLYSAASIMSVPQYNTRSPVQNTFQPPLNPLQSSRTEETVMVTSTARALFEEREVAADAIPLCTQPDDVIAGDHGLVRCIILNDRINALTVDTAGEVAVWDIVRGICLGKYPPEDVAAASHAGSTGGGSGEKERSPREALEAVRERIEGEAVVSTWCMADTKGGVLTIHMTERCFEAEVYADEVGFDDNRQFNDESKRGSYFSWFCAFFHHIIK
jgi:WD repeat-containing protein 48